MTKSRAFLFIFLMPMALMHAKNVVRQDVLTGQALVLDASVDYHLTSALPLSNSTIDLTSPDAWLFFDQVKPSVVLSNYKQSLKINGVELKPTINARVTRCINGTLVVPQFADLKPFTTFSETGFGGSGVNYFTDWYYSNRPGSFVPSTMQKPLGMDENAMRSFRLKRGFMVTLANNPDGTGYSRVFIADTADLDVAELPELLDRKVSFIRVFKWNYTSKKGWAGGDPSAAMSDALDCTWFYTWGATDSTTANLEFCPERWGLSWPTWDVISSIKNTSHLLSFNEPDHTEQSNISVDNAVADWPRHLQTGMRLGSPATTNFDWLYEFMDKCNAKNYRVDFVVVHGYWGGISPQEWYNRLYTVHMKTGKPIWIKEWNNGANWTNESWPDDPSTLTAANAAKQLSDLKGILNVLDTAQFIERYSIYNWVENARAMILNWDKTTKKGTLTPAGEFYKSNSSGMAFNKAFESIPDWKVREEPVVSYQYIPERSQIQLSWTDYNEEAIQGYRIERSTDNVRFYKIGMVDGPYTKVFYDDLLSSGQRGTVYYRVVSMGKNEVEKYSNVVSYELLNSDAEKAVGELYVSTNTWMHCHYNKPWTSAPIVVFGTPSYMNKSPMTHRMDRVQSGSFNFKLDSWNYLNHPIFAKVDTISYMMFTPGTHVLGGLALQADSISGVSTSWKTVLFSAPFVEVPVVFASQTTNRATPPSTVRIKNVTTKGFDVALQYEQATTLNNPLETVNYIAATPGAGLWNNRMVQVGRTSDLSVGNYFSFQTIPFGSTYTNPAFFASMQTQSDGITSTLRYRKITSDYAEVFKDREISKSTTAVSKETVGWMVVQLEMPDRIQNVIYPSNVSFITTPEELLFNSSEPLASATVFSMLGKRMISVKNVNRIDLRGLNSGLYILSVLGRPGVLFQKK